MGCTGCKNSEVIAVNIQAGTKKDPLLELALGGGSLSYKQQVLKNMQTKEQLNNMEIQMKELAKEQAKKKEKDEKTAGKEHAAVNQDGDEVIISEAAQHEYSSHAAASSVEAAVETAEVETAEAAASPHKE